MRAQLQRRAWCIVCCQIAGDARDIKRMTGLLCGMAVMNRGMQQLVQGICADGTGPQNARDG